MRKNHTIENGILMVNGRPPCNTEIHIDVQPRCVYDGCKGCNLCCQLPPDTRSDEQIKRDIEMCEQDGCRGCGACIKRPKHK